MSLISKRKAERLIVIDIDVAVRRKRDFALNRHLYIQPFNFLTQITTDTDIGVGLTSRHFVIPISKHQDTIGPMTRTVKDAARIL